MLLQLSHRSYVGPSPKACNSFNKVQNHEVSLTQSKKDMYFVSRYKHHKEDN